MTPAAPEVSVGDGRPAGESPVQPDQATAADVSVDAPDRNRRPPRTPMLRPRSRRGNRSRAGRAAGRTGWLYGGYTGRVPRRAAGLPFGARRDASRCGLGGWGRGTRRSTGGRPCRARPSRCGAKGDVTTRAGMRGTGAAAARREGRPRQGERPPGDRPRGESHRASGRPAAARRASARLAIAGRGRSVRTGRWARPGGPSRRGRRRAPAEPAGPRHDRPSGGPEGPRPDRRFDDRRDAAQNRREDRRDKQPDPDSPFAKLAALKAQARKREGNKP